MPQDKYNGWANYETWCVKLWMDNECAMYERQKELLEQAREDTSERDTVNVLADLIKDEIEEMKPETTGLFADLINAALSDVDWREIATHVIDENPEESEES